MSQPPSGSEGDPIPLGYAVPPSGPDLRRIAFQQRAIILCILVMLVCALLEASVTASGLFFLRPIGLVIMLGAPWLYLASIITGAVFVFMLAISLYNTGTGIAMGILALVPCLGLIALLVVNGKATRVLRHHGVKVGFFGASPSKIPR
jgi:hypothetical protein